jgi:hypothetical protein
MLGHVGVLVKIHVQMPVEQQQNGGPNPNVQLGHEQPHGLPRLNVVKIDWRAWPIGAPACSGSEKRGNQAWSGNDHICINNGANDHKPAYLSRRTALISLLISSSGQHGLRMSWHYPASCSDNVPIAYKGRLSSQSSFL